MMRVKEESEKVKAQHSENEDHGIWSHPFIPSGVISPLVSSSILGTYRPGEFLSVSYHFACSYCSWEIDGETVSDFIFLGSKITADGDCGHEIKRC